MVALFIHFYFDIELIIGICIFEVELVFVIVVEMELM